MIILDISQLVSLLYHPEHTSEKTDEGIFPKCETSLPRKNIFY